jgi:hypothetical protein
MRLGERSRVRDFINKLSAGLVRLLPNSIHVFEALDKESLTSKERFAGLGGREMLEHLGGGFTKGYLRLL